MQHTLNILQIIYVTQVLKRFRIFLYIFNQRTILNPKLFQTFASEKRTQELIKKSTVQPLVAKVLNNVRWKTKDLHDKYLKHIYLLIYEAGQTFIFFNIGIIYRILKYYIYQGGLDKNIRFPINRKPSCKTIFYYKYHKTIVFFSIFQNSYNFVLSNSFTVSLIYKSLFCKILPPVYISQYFKVLHRHRNTASHVTFFTRVQKKNHLTPCPFKNSRTF